MLIQNRLIMYFYLYQYDIVYNPTNFDLNNERQYRHSYVYTPKLI